MTHDQTTRGRPIDPEIQQQKKQQLMDAAYKLLQHKSFRSISIREIAAAADMKSAMISYYFGTKEGLFVALLERLAQQQFERFQLAEQADNPLKEFIRTAVCYFSQNRPVTRLFADEVLFQKSTLSERFIELFPKRMAVFLPTLIAEQQQKGSYRADVNPNWAAFSLMTMLVMPFVGDSVRRLAWGISDAQVTSEDWVEHIYQLFTAGISAEEVDNES